MAHGLLPMGSEQCKRCKSDNSSISGTFRISRGKVLVVVALLARLDSVISRLSPLLRIVTRAALPISACTGLLAFIALQAIVHGFGTQIRL